MGDSTPHKAPRLIGTVWLFYCQWYWHCGLPNCGQKPKPLINYTHFAAGAAKTEMVIREADQARAKAKASIAGAVLSGPSALFIAYRSRPAVWEDLIYANGKRFICSTSVHQQTGWRMPAGPITPKSRMSRFYYRDTDPGFAMNYMQKGPWWWWSIPSRSAQ